GWAPPIVSAQRFAPRHAVRKDRERVGGDPHDDLERLTRREALREETLELGIGNGSVRVHDALSQLGEGAELGVGKAPACEERLDELWRGAVLAREVPVNVAAQLAVELAREHQRDGLALER